MRTDDGATPRGVNAHLPARLGPLAAVLLTVTVTAVAGCGGSTSDSSTPTSAPVLNVISTRPPTTIDPAKLTDVPDDIIGNAYIQMTKFGEKAGPDGTTQIDQTKVEPYLAESWTSADDFKTWTFTLKPGLKFASGTPVDSAAVKFSYERALRFISAYVINDGLTGNVQQIDTPDANTVVIHLKQGNPQMPNVLATAPASIEDPSVTQAQSEDYLAGHAAGSGPFRLTQYQPNQLMVFKKNPAFAKWNRSGPAADEIRVQFVQSDAAALLKARSGQADVVIGLSNQAASSLKGNSKVRLLVNDTSETEQVLLPWAKPPFGSQKVRQALAEAVPYDDIVASVAKGWGRLFYGPLNPTMQYFDAALEPPVETNLAHAQELMRQSGVKTPVSVVLTINAGNPIHQQIATLLQSAWKPLGIDMSVRQVPPAQYSDAIFGQRAQAALRLDGPAYDEPGYFLGYDMVCRQNPNNICIPAADKALAAARASSDTAANAERYAQIQKLWRPLYPKIFLYSAQNVTVLSNAVKDWQYDLAQSMVAWSK